MSPDEKRDELELLLLREAVSLLVFAAIMVALSPQAHMWLRAQKRRWTGRRSAARDEEEQALAEVRAEISRMEHGG